MNVRNLTAQLLVLGLLHLSLLNGVSKLQAAPSPDLKQRVEQFGVGTELKLKLQNGEKLRGSVTNIGEDSFTIASTRNGAAREVAFSELKNANYPKRGYKTQSTPDPLAAKRTVVQLGVGEHIMVMVSPTQKVRGQIREIQDDHFVVQPDGRAETLRVPYGSVWKVNKNISVGATIAIVVGIAAVVVLILVLSGEDEIDVLPDNR
jgi:ribosome maturation factor RimP